MAVLDDNLTPFTTGNTSKIAEENETDDLPCHVCGEWESDDPNNLLIICDGCDVPVHQDCYGVEEVPEGDWFCYACLGSKEGKNVEAKLLQCELCPTKGPGAFHPVSRTSSSACTYKKHTGDEQLWCHTACGFWVHETFFPDSMEEVQGLHEVPKARWDLVCELCRRKRGAPTQCCERTCVAAFHPLCAREAGLYCRLLTMKGAQLFCNRHRPDKAEWKAKKEARRMNKERKGAQRINKDRDAQHINKEREEALKRKQEKEALQKKRKKEEETAITFSAAKEESAPTSQKKQRPSPEALHEEKVARPTEHHQFEPSAQAESLDPDLEEDVEKAEALSPAQRCDICAGTGTASRMVCCIKCNVTVHAECYGVVLLSGDSFVCHSCTHEGKKQFEQVFDCALCPIPDGAFHHTEEGYRVHTVCAMWIPELGFTKDSSLAKSLSKVDPERFKLRCEVCQIAHGAPIQCSEGACAEAFHPLCARQFGLFMDLYPDQQARCHRHSRKRVIKSLKNLMHKKTDGKLNANELLLKRMASATKQDRKSEVKEILSQLTTMPEARLKKVMNIFSNAGALLISTWLKDAAQDEAQHNKFTLALLAILDRMENSITMRMLWVYDLMKLTDAVADCFTDNRVRAKARELTERWRRDLVAKYQIKKWAPGEKVAVEGRHENTRNGTVVACNSDGTYQVAYEMNIAEDEDEFLLHELNVIPERMSAPKKDDEDSDFDY